MRIRVSLVPICAAALLSCSTTQPAPPAFFVPQQVITQLAPAPPPTDLPPVRACHVGANTPSCLDLDTRPFESCLLGADRCPRDGQIVPLVSAGAVEPR